MCCSNDGEIHWQHVKSDLSESLTVVGKRWNDKFRNCDIVFLPFASQKQNCLSRMEPSCPFENRLE